VAVLLLGTTLAALGVGWSLSLGVSSLAATSGPPGGVNVEPSMRPWRYVGANPQSWWCQPPNCSSDFANPVATATREMQQAKALGAQNIRLEIPWPLIETSRGVWDWSRADALFQAASQVGITIEPVLMWTPQWAGGGSQLTQPPSAGDMQAFAQAFAQRYDAVIKRGVEVWNEEDGGKYFTGSAVTYVSQILNPAYAGIKSVDGGIPVILGGTGSDTTGAYLQSVISAGGRFNIAAFHNYVGSALGQAQTYGSTLSASGLGSTPIWLGEYGSESGTSGQVTLIQQALGQTSALAMAQWYNLRDTDSWACCPPADVDAGTWGLLTASFTEKSSFSTMQGYLSSRIAPPPPAWSAPAPPPTSSSASARVSASSGAGTPSSTGGSASASASASVTPSPASPALTPSGPGGGPASPTIVSSADPGVPHGGVPWGALAALCAVAVVIGAGVAGWRIPSLRRRILRTRPPI
jgi:hypothetical protein